MWLATELGRWPTHARFDLQDDEELLLQRVALLERDFGYYTNWVIGFLILSDQRVVYQQGYRDTVTFDLHFPLSEITAVEIEPWIQVWWLH